MVIDAADLLLILHVCESALINQKPCRRHVVNLSPEVLGLIERLLEFTGAAVWPVLRTAECFMQYTVVAATKAGYMAHNSSDFTLDNSLL